MEIIDVLQEGGGSAMLFHSAHAPGSMNAQMLPLVPQPVSKVSCLSWQAGF